MTIIQHCCKIQIYTLYTLIPEQLESKLSSSKTVTVRDHKPPVSQPVRSASDSGDPPIAVHVTLVKALVIGKCLKVP